MRNEGSEDLVVCKVYQVLPDAVAAKEGYLRVVDESGEDCLYPADYFIPLALPDVAARRLTEIVQVLG